MTAKKIQDKIKILKSFAGSQAKLAEIAGVAQPLVSAWINGQREVQDEAISALAEFFEIPVGMLTNDAEELVIKIDVREKMILLRKRAQSKADKLITVCDLISLLKGFPRNAPITFGPHPCGLEFSQVEMQGRYANFQFNQSIIRDPLSGEWIIEDTDGGKAASEYVRHRRSLARGKKNPIGKEVSK
ncbi:transcriptional regulator [Opitutaceae bacterium TAV5]|nr:transcriptional regulator [Opitutaceae bacterium TAV5]